MRRLMLLRHAKTEHDAPSGHDHDRRLDERGRLDAAAIVDVVLKALRKNSVGVVGGARA